MALLLLSIALLQKEEIRISKSQYDPSCNLCQIKLKKSFYNDYDYEKFLKSLDWVKSVNKNQKFQTIEYEVIFKKPLFSYRNGLFYDENQEIFFHPTNESIPRLSFDTENFTSEDFKAAIEIKSNMKGFLHLSHSKISGWTIHFNNLIVKIGKNNIKERLDRLKIVFINYEENNLNNKILDLRYKDGFTIAEK